MKSPGIATLSLALGLALMAAAGVAGQPDDPGLIDRHDVRLLRDRLRRDAPDRREVLQSAAAALEREGVPANERAGLIASIETRMARELERYAGSLRGRRFDSLDRAAEAIEARERILVHAATSSPRAYAEGQPLPYVVDGKELVRLEFAVGVMVRTHEAGLRDAVRALESRGDLTSAQVRALRTLVQRQAEAHAKELLGEMVDAPFFSSAAASAYLEQAVRAELQGALERVNREEGRTALLGEALAVRGR